MSISLIWAMAANGVIGKDNDMPWHLPRDFDYFKSQTLGKRMLMGRKTWDSLGGKPLKGRTSIVLTRDRSFAPEGAEIVHSLEEAVAEGRRDDELMVIGGAEIYKMMLPYADKLLVTRIAQDFEGDTRFPEVDWSGWREISNSPGFRDEKNPYDYRFYVYERPV
ncbi:dihydrofolate reductase [Paenibacillus riograndensis]|uniref:Dihydrofolate reductase n=1 Tax=Paenibacillus riograndensis TaxID=483937 RepID=A0A132U224_9BACL|nr:dihydrofolate reductase [Paenibacillus riograndensis]KWX77628.1 dihydrofolate reductase [Paenibacillus riograndensis]KWX84810.1 dihydrofolate reductase [Paenibacillus riograndensis]